MRKQVEVISADGKKKEAGYVEVSINYTYKTEQVHNRGTHEEETKRIPYSKVEAFRHGSDKPFRSVETKGTDRLLDHVRTMEQTLREHLIALSKQREQPTLEDRLEAMGYVDTEWKE
jgi:hypothetical protein